MAIDTKIWHRCIAHIDMCSFFPSIELLDYPELKGQAIAVTNGTTGSTIISSCYIARSFGIKTGMKLREARTLCPHLIQRGSRPGRYIEVSSNVMTALESITPDCEIFSVDELWLNLKPILSHYDSIDQLASKIRRTVYDASGGLPCSVGISEGKLTAKVCSKFRKGYTTIIPPQTIKQFLAPLPVGDICGIGRRTERHLNNIGVYTCADLGTRPMTVLSARSGNIGKRLYLSSQGYDPEPVCKEEAAPKSIGHGKVLPPNIKDREMVAALLRLQCEKVARRLRKNNMKCDLFELGLKVSTGWLWRELKTVKPIHDGSIIWYAAKVLLNDWKSGGAFKMQVNAKHLVDDSVEQLDLFDQPACDKNEKINALKDQINAKFGPNTIAPANMLKAVGATVDVIAPSWRSSGARQSISK